MRAKETKQISISEYLQLEGHKPQKARLSGRELWFSSPLRAGDSNPSFKVDTQLNLWFDHGLAKWGDVINLVCELHNISVRHALALLESSWLSSKRISPNIKLTQNWLTLPFPKKESPAGEKEKEGYFSITQVWELQSPALIQYLDSRKINLDIARTYLKEIRFKPRNQLRDYFALGWPNGDGFEARSKLFKGFVGTSKDITRIGLGDWKSLSIFEGFFDYLAFLSHHKITQFRNSVIILNSTSLRKRALAEINQFNFSKIYLFLDNDTAGDDCKNFFKLGSEDLQIIDGSFLYKNHKDYNSWLINQEN